MTSTQSVAEAPNTIKGRATSTTAILTDYLIVTYAIPAERVGAAVPDGLLLDRLPGAGGELMAFLQTACVFYQALRWSPLPEFTGDAFHQVVYRILIRRSGKPGYMVLNTFINSSERHISRRLIDTRAEYVRLSLYIDGNPAVGEYRMYSLRARGDEGQRTSIDVVPESQNSIAPLPFGSLPDMISFLTRREEHFYHTWLPRDGVGVIPQQHEPFAPVFGKLTLARMAPWTERGLLKDEELMQPLSVFIQPKLTVISGPPRIARLQKT